jgi:hypothetical protein
MTPEQIRQRRAAEVMEGPLGRAIYSAVYWRQEHWPHSNSGDELRLNPQDDGALVLIGGTVLGHQVCASGEVPSGKALIYCKLLGMCVGEGQMPDSRFSAWTPFVPSEAQP